MTADPTLNLGLGSHGQRRWTGSHGPHRGLGDIEALGHTPERPPVSKADRMGPDPPPGAGCGVTPWVLLQPSPMAARGSACASL